MATSKNSTRRRIGVSDAQHAARPTLKDCLDVVMRQADSLIDATIDALASTLDPASGGVGAARRVHTPAVKLAIQQLVAKRLDVRKSFVSHLEKMAYRGGATLDQTRAVVRFEDLQMLEQDQLDESIELARAQQEVALSVDDVLPSLDAVMSTLLGWITVQSLLNPLRPEVFVRALRDSFSENLEDTGARGELLAPAAGRLGVSLRQVYRETTEWLRSTGVEPASTTAPGWGQVDKASVRNPEAAPNSVTRTLLTLERLRRLLSGELEPDAPLFSGQRKPPKDFLHTVPASVEALQDMQQVDAMVRRLSARAKQVSAPAVNADVNPSDKPALLDGKQLGQQVGEEVTRMMLENLVLDDRLLPSVRSELSQLEGVLLKVAQIDGRFFSDKSHSARQFLDQITHRSLAYASEEEEGFAHFIASVKGSVSALNASSAAGQSSFAPLMLELRERWLNEDRAQRQRHEEAARALLHAEQRHLLAQRLVQEFRARCAGKDVPAEVAVFLGGPWSHAVAESQLSCADGTTDPMGLVAVVDDLIWSVQPRLTRRNPTRLVELIPVMLTKLRQGLQLLSFPPEKITEFFDQLIALHESALDGIRRASEAAIKVETTPTLAHWDEPPPANTPDQSDAFWLGASEASEAGYFSADTVLPADASEFDASSEDESEGEELKVGDLNNGAWVELLLDGSWVRAQLIWASPHRTLFMFTSKGGRAHSMSRRTMERLLLRGVIHLVANGHVLDNAFDGVAKQAMSNTLGHSS